MTCDDLMARLIALRSALPGANVSALVARHPQILQQSSEQIQHAADVVGASARPPARRWRAGSWAGGTRMRPQTGATAGSSRRRAHAACPPPHVPQAHELLAELDGEADQLLQAAPYLLDAALLPAVLADLEATFPGFPAPYLLQQHVKLGSVHLQRYRPGSG